MKVFGLILAGGLSERFASSDIDSDKLLCRLGSETVLERSVRILDESNTCDELYVISQGDYYAFLGKTVKMVKGGGTRFESMSNGVESFLGEVEKVDYPNSYVLIHNAANPGITTDEIKACIRGAKENGGCGVAHSMKDTIRRKYIEDEPRDIFETLDRKNLYAMQTPQCIRLDLLLAGIDHVNVHNVTTNLANDEGMIFPTDDLQLLDLTNEKYLITPASETNFKITTREDLLKMRAVLGFGGEGGIDVRVGVGQDSHEFSDSGELILGGIQLSDYPKLKANSDGDVLLHALFNAISSALGDGSLGQTADAMHEDGVSDSKEYLKVILKKMRNAGFTIGNLSISIICEKPKIDMISYELKESLVQIIQPYSSDFDVSRIGITATTGEGNFSKNASGLACTCYVSLT